MLHFDTTFDLQNKFCCDITYRADGVDSLPFLGVVFTHSYQPVALLVYDSVCKSELAALCGERLDVTSLAGQLCFVKPLVSAEVIILLRRENGRGEGGACQRGEGVVLVIPMSPCSTAYIAHHISGSKGTTLRWLLPWLAECHCVP